MSALSTYLHRTLPQVWLRRGWVARLLWPLSLLYGAVWRSQQRAAKRQPAVRLPVPVLVIGNVVAGGAGKTPTAIAVVQHFQRMGVAVGVVSRGYGRRGDAPACLSITATTSAQNGGDEPVLIHWRTHAPVVVCAQRVQAAKTLLAQFPATQLIVCDDGLQHLALPRDGEICVMDERGIGNGWLLPAGPLREPWPRRTTFLLHTAPPQSPDAVPPLPAQQATYQAQRRLADAAVQADGKQHPLAAWAHAQQPVAALAGIAQPERFFAMLRKAGMQLRATQALADHASAAQMHAAAQRLLATGLPVLCTEKDAVKLWPALPQVWAVPLQLLPEARFFDDLTAWWQALADKRTA